MFDLDSIENDWKANSFKLSEEEIIKIYQSEEVTQNKYFNDLKEYDKNTHVKMDPEERLLATIFGGIEKIKIEEQKLREKYKEPTKKRLSEQSQRIVIEGCLDVVFEKTKYWYDYFNKNLDMEEIYYVCLESLINSVKYCLHNEKTTFRNFASRNIEKSIIKYIAKLEHISYRDVWCIMYNNGYRFTDDIFLSRVNKMHFHYNYNKEVCEKPSRMYNYLKDKKYDVDYIKNISSKEFMKEYNDVLKSFDDETLKVMKLVYDSEGNPGLTFNEIGDFLGIEPKKVSNIKRKTLKKLRNNERIISYR